MPAEPIRQYVEVVREPVRAYDPAACPVCHCPRARVDHEGFCLDCGCSALLTSKATVKRPGTGDTARTGLMYATGAPPDSAVR